MKNLWITLAFSLSLTGATMAQEPEISSPQDPYLWLEDVTGDEALNWVKARNAESGAELAESAAFASLKAGLLKIMDAKDRIAFVTKTGPYFYNFWRDEKNPAGLWRRTTLAEYRKAKPKWDVILDVDALNNSEQENWVWHGAQILKAGGWRHVLVRLSRGGADAGVVREFDLESRRFVVGGFALPEAKGGLSWIDKDSVYVFTDFGPGSLTASGYPRIAKLWQRGTPLASAQVVFEGKDTDMFIGAAYDDTKGFERHFVYRTPAFYKNELFLRSNDGQLRRVEVPEDATAQAHRQWLMIELRTPWTVNGKTYAAGSLLVARFDDYMKGRRELTVLFEPTLRTSLAGYSWTRHHLILNVLEDVKNTLVVVTPGKHGWSRQALSGAPGYATVAAEAVDSDENDDYFMTTSGYLTPTALLHGTIGQTPVKLKELPAFFDANGLEVTQHFATSKDGTKVPYFEVARTDLKLDGTNPTLLYGYGGFEVSLTPDYNAGTGLAWLAQGGVYVVANIRGGGEYGPRWHQAALKEGRHRAFEDFAAVAEDLIARKVTTPRHLGIQGGSNGGLLVGNMITLHPELFGAVVCQVPLLDMKRYSHLLAGASWMAEYGDPDKAEDWKYVRTFSPYQNLNAVGTYPPTLFMTSTRDDRVHPGHARKMMARMRELGANVRYYENIEGGHGGAANNAQGAHMRALAFTFLWQQLR